jgi:hypothetical protein
MSQVVDRLKGHKLVKRLAIIAAMLAGLIVTGYLAAVIAVLVMMRVDFDPAPFDSAVWIATPAEDSHESMRLRMVDDLLNNHLKPGMTREEVVDLLGVADDTFYFIGYDMVYRLGAERSSFAIDSEWLVINLATNNTVTEAVLTRD